jgi:hypothetical protein
MKTIKLESTSIKSYQQHFQKKYSKINKFQDQMSYSLMIYKNKKETKENKKLTKHLQK